METGSSRFVFFRKKLRMFSHGGIKTPHARLRRLLALKRRVVLVDEYLTTKRCPNCIPLPDAPLQRGEARPLSLPLHFHGSTAWRGSVHASRRSGGEEACSRAFAMLPQKGDYLDAVESGLRGDAEHRQKKRSFFSPTAQERRVFVEQWQAGVRPAYLCRPSTMCVAAS